jgi:hypothetical protein
MIVSFQKAQAAGVCLGQTGSIFLIYCEEHPDIDCFAISTPRVPIPVSEAPEALWKVVEWSSACAEQSVVGGSCLL